jgi:hypothetical protein
MQIFQYITFIILAISTLSLSPRLSYADGNIREEYQRWTYQFDNFKDVNGLEVKVTYLSGDLLRSWLAKASTADTKRRAEDILNRAQKDGVSIYMIQLRTDGGWLKIANPNKDISLFTLDETAGVQPIDATMNLSRKVDGKQSAYGLVVFKTKGPVGPFQSLILNVQYGGSVYIVRKRGETSSEFEDRYKQAVERDKMGFHIASIHISFLPSGVPEVSRPSENTNTVDVIGMMKLAMDVLSLITFKVPFKL